MEEGQTPSEDRNVGVNFTPWICLTADTEMDVRPDWIVTIVTPVKEIEKLYEEMINGWCKFDCINRWDYISFSNW